MKLPANLTDDDQAALVAAMPASAVELVECIGFEAVIALVRAYGGRRANIPRSPTPGHPLSVAIGQEAATTLGAAFGQCQFEVPALARVRLLLRDNGIRADFDAGATLDDLTTRYCISERHARKVLSASTATSPRL